MKKAAQDKPLDSATAEKVLKADLGNLLKKVQAGIPLTERQRALINSSASPESAIDPSELAISSAELCKVTGLTDQRHRQIAAEGFIPHQKNGKHPLLETVKGLIRYYRELASRMKAGIAEDKALKTKKEIELLEIKIAEQKRELVPIAGVESVWSRVCIALRQVILAADMPEHVKTELCGHIQDINPEEYAKPDSDAGEEVSEDS